MKRKSKINEHITPNKESSGIKLVLKVNSQNLDETPTISKGPVDGLTESVKRSYKRRKKMTDNVKILEYNEESSQSMLDDSILKQKSQLINDQTTKDEQSLKIRIFRDESIKTSFQHFLSHLQKLLQRKDYNGFFAYPVTDAIAPGYSCIITQPMDFHTMQVKIEKNIYTNLNEYRNDFKLMLNNCMLYNHSDSVYHRTALKLLKTGLKYMSKDRILQMKRSLSFMMGVTKEQLSFDDDTSLDDITDATTLKMATEVSDSDESRVLMQAESAAAQAASQLKLKKPNDKMGFIRLNEDGTTSFTFLNPDNTGVVTADERVMKIGECVGYLRDGTNRLIQLNEDKRNIVTPVSNVEYEAFGSFLPFYDSSETNISKQDSSLLLSVYGSEEGWQYANSITSFVADTNDYVISMVDELLDVLTNGEHTKYMRQETEARSLAETIQPQMISNQPTISQSNTNHIDTYDARLLETSELLMELHNLQVSRLSAPLSDTNGSAHLSSDSVFKQELKIANNLTQQLKSLVKESNPGDIIDKATLHRVMGIDLPQNSSNNISEKNSVNTHLLNVNSQTNMFTDDNLNECMQNSANLPTQTEIPNFNDIPEIPLFANNSGTSFGAFDPATALRKQSTDDNLAFSGINYETNMAENMAAMLDVDTASIQAAVISNTPFNQIEQNGAYYHQEAPAYSSIGQTEKNNLLQSNIELITDSGLGNINNQLIDVGQQYQTQSINYQYANSDQALFVGSIPPIPNMNQDADLTNKPQQPSENLLIINELFGSKDETSVEGVSAEVTTNTQLSEQQLAEQQNAILFLSSIDSNNDLEYRMILDECIAPE